MQFRQNIFCQAVILTVTLALAPPSLLAEGVEELAIAEFSLPDSAGHRHALSDFGSADLVIVAFLGVDCPLAKLYAGRLQALSEEYPADKVRFMAVMSNAQDSMEEIAAYAKKHGLEFPVVRDDANRVADQFGATRTPEVFLLDRERVVRYSGRVDDQHLVGVKRDAPTREDLRAAIDELLAGKPVSRPRADAIGCLIGRQRQAKPGSTVTYTRDVAPILQRRCVECHRAGEIGPFELTSYEEAAGWADMSLEVINDRRMPPWHADPAHGEFANDRSMPTNEIKVLQAWLRGGCPEGDPDDLPAPRAFTSGWQLPREPDQVWAMSERSYNVPANAGPSGVPYQYFRVDSGFDEDTWIEASEVQPGNREVVHHIIVYAEPPKSRRRRDWVFLTAYVPGLRFDPLPPGTAKMVPAGSRFVFEQHYTPVGSKQEDISRLGVVFADAKKVRQEVVTAEVGNVSFRIPPHEADHVVTATSRPLRRGVTLLSLSPHMHLRGKSFKYEAVLPDGRREVLLSVPGYDFNWQTRYLLEKPRRLPKGSLIHCRAVFDNSAENPANPNPDDEVRWGDQSWDEMMLGYFDIVRPRGESDQVSQKPVTTGWDVVGQFDDADADGSGSLSRTEADSHRLLRNRFDLVDRDRDGEIVLKEIFVAVRALRDGF
ncbi:MAG: redoxin domain-containing protein [Planctomycetota bacterium]